MPEGASSQAGLREIFDDISSQTIKYLEQHQGVSKVQFLDRAPATAADITRWEKANAPCMLPDDFKAFLLIANGLLLEWSILFRGAAVPLGCMSLNSLEDVVPLMVDDRDSQVGEDGVARSECEWAGGGCHCFRAFAIDSRMLDGHLALFYPNRNDRPQVWFQDLSCCWNFLCDSFTDFFRLMIAHLGLPRWPYVFTQQGLDPASRQWFRLLAPQRLAIDEESRQAHESKQAEAQQQPTLKLDWNLIDAPAAQPKGNGSRALDLRKKQSSARPSTTPSAIRSGALTRPKR